MLAHLRLANFRNYDRGEIAFSPGINFFRGENGQGKTNILEAVYYLSLLRSFRTSQINHLRQWGKDFFYLEAECEKDQGERIFLSVSSGRERRLLLNGVAVSRASDFINHFICAAFIPEDLEIIQGPAILRRRFLDIAISQLSPAYLRALQKYSTALKNRNIMLKQPGKYPLRTITAYDEIIVEKGTEIEISRREIIEKLNQALKKQAEIFFSEKTLAIKFLTGLGTLLKSPENYDCQKLSEIYRETLQKNLPRDCREGNTRYGPHRSEMHFLLNDNSLSLFGSKGECRTTALALRFACLEVLQQQWGCKDVTVIVDDVLGELDREKQKIFLNQLPCFGQVLIAGTVLPEEIKSISKVFSVVGGRCQEI